MEFYLRSGFGAGDARVNVEVRYRRFGERLIRSSKLSVGGTWFCGEW